MTRQAFLKIAGVAASLVLGAVLAAQQTAPQPVPPPDPNKVVFSAGDAKMTVAEFEAFLGELHPDVQMQARGPNRRRIAEDVVRMKLLAAEASKLRLDQTPQFEMQMRIMRDNALAGAMIKKLQGELVKEEDIKKEYEAKKDAFVQATVRHILIEPGPDLTEEKARAKAEDIKKRLDAGGDFAAIARAESTDKVSAQNDGLIGPLRRGQMPPEFQEKAFAMPVGQLSDPVKTRYGYHIIKVDARGTLPLEDVRQEIADELLPAKLQQYVDDLYKKANARLDETYFGPPLPAIGPATVPTQPPGLER